MFFHSSPNLTRTLTFIILTFPPLCSYNIFYLLGKTTSCTVIAREMGYDVVELNASDVRNKSSLESLLKMASNTTHPFSPFLRACCFQMILTVSRAPSFNNLLLRINIYPFILTSTLFLTRSSHSHATYCLAPA